MQGMVIYCERAGSGWWAEPLNALTSLACVVAAVAAVALCRSSRVAASARGWDVRLLIALAALVGATGFAWHTVSGAWAGRLDAILLHAFLNLYLVVYLSRAAGFGTFVQIAALVAFQAALVGALAVYPPTWLNGSLLYLPGIAVLGLLVWLAWSRSSGGAAAMTAGAALFGVAVAFHATDLYLCPVIPTGTHFLWHLTTAAVLYLLLRALLLAAVPSTDAR